MISISSFVRLVAAAFLVCWLLSPTCGAEITSEDFKPENGVSVPWISVIGDIVASDAARFQAIANQTEGVAVVYFDSPGGDLEVGIKLGRLIRKRGWDTAVNTTCASACALAWLAGEKKIASETARIGFHVAYVGNDLKAESGLGNALVGLYLGELGLGENVVRYVTSAPPDGMQWLSFRDARLLGIDVIPIAGAPIERRAPEVKKPPSSNGSKLPGLDLNNIDRAIKNAMARYKEAGMQGLLESSRSCWNVVRQKRTLDKVQYCRVLDLIGMGLNDVAIRRLGPKAGVHHFSSDRRISDLIDGMAATGISDPGLAKRLVALWQTQFEQRFSMLIAP